MPTPPGRRTHIYPCYLLILLPMIACCLLHCAAAESRPTTDEAELLLRIKRAWGDPPVLAAWNRSAAISAVGAHCRWPYVGCDTAGRVISLALDSLNLTGHVPDAVGGFSSLAKLDLSNNSITGMFPIVLYRCGSLRYLDLSSNNFGGELPHDIGHGLAGNLRTLVLNSNNFNGSIPASLSRLQNLRHLDLYNNILTGTIPIELGELRSLETLWLAWNSFDPGKLPTSFKNMTKLVSLWAAGCGLVGNFPSYVVNMTELELLDFAAMSLTKVRLSDNNFVGAIPEVYGHLENLTRLWLDSNNFSGEIPASISRLPSLEMMSLSSNRLTGTIPSELGKHSPALSYVSVDKNELTGGIPEWLCAGGQLQEFSASINRFNGSIPVGLAKCAALQELDLSSNQLSGNVLWTAMQANVAVNLRDNQLTGSLPDTISSKLMWLDIGNNQFVGRIPSVAIGLEYFSADNNQLSGDIPASLSYGMPMLQKLNLRNNKLSGRIS